MSRPFTHPAARDITIDGVLHALSDRIRRDIVFRLLGCDKKHGLNCSESCEGLSPSTISFHYKVLREAGLIHSEKKGVEVINIVRRDEIEKCFPGLIDTVFQHHKSTISPIKKKMINKFLTPVNLALIALAVSAFGIGTTEFVIMGLLPDVARDLDVSIPSAGLLITGYAWGVAIGAPIMAVMTSKFPRKNTLIMLMGIFIAGNALCATATDYNLLMFARVVTSLCHGAFFGIGSVTAAGLVPENKRASAVAMMFTGLTLANVLGVPMGTALGQEAGWRMTFWAVTIIGIVAFAGLVKLLPADKKGESTNIMQEIGALKNGGVWIALLMTVLFSASMFTLFTYIAPMLTDLTGVSPRGITYTLLLIGLGLTVGNVIGGKLTDWKMGHTLVGTAIVIALTQVGFYWTSGSVIPAEITLFLWAATAFAAVSALQLNAMIFGKNAPSLISTLNIGAFNAGNALGAWAGAVVLDAGFGLRVIPLYAAGFAVIGLAVTFLSFHMAKQKNGT